MKVLVEFDYKKFAEIAEAYHPDLVKETRCCNGHECGCGGVPDSDREEAVTQLESDVISDVGLLGELLTVYEKSFTLKEIV